MEYRFAPVYQEEDGSTLESIMFIARDITQEVKLKREARERAEKAEFIHKVLKNRDSYIDYLTETHNCINFLVDTLPELDEERVLAAFRASHSIKGNSAIYGIKSLRDSSHVLEDLLMEVREGMTPITTELLKSLVKKAQVLSEAFDQHIREAEITFGDQFDPREDAEYRYVIHESKLRKLIHLSESQDLVNELRMIRLKPIQVFLSPYEDMVITLAERLSKNVHPLRLRGEEVLIDPERWRSFFSSFVHLIRNCMDHGIESPERRKELGKDPMATVAIEVSDDEEGISLWVSDDGAGIDPNEVAKVALERGVIDAETCSAMSDLEKQMLIFKPGFTTKKEVSIVSGRGIGMDAVHYEVMQLQGDISIDSRLGEGSTFTIRIPYATEGEETIARQSNGRLFDRVELPIYLPVSDDDGQPMGYIANISPDGFRFITGDVDLGEGQIHMNIFLDTEDLENDEISLFARPVNQTQVKENHREWGFLIESFDSAEDQVLYEAFLRRHY